MAATMRRVVRRDAELGAEVAGGATVWRHRALRARLLVDDEHLRGRARAGYRDLEHVIAVEPGRDRGVTPDELLPILAALTVVAGMREVYASREAQAIPDQATERLLHLIGQVLDFARAGLAGSDLDDGHRTDGRRI